MKAIRKTLVTAYLLAALATYGHAAATLNAGYLAPAVPAAVWPAYWSTVVADTPAAETTTHHWNT
jgi:hypothetical protein